MEMPVTIALKTIQCSCGILYAVPNWLVIHVCPSCSGRRIERLNKSVDAEYKRISSLQGVITRLKNTIKFLKEE